MLNIKELSMVHFWLTRTFSRGQAVLGCIKVRVNQKRRDDKNLIFWRQAQIFLYGPFSFGDLCVLYIANWRMLLGIHNDVVCRNGYFLMQYRKQKVWRLFFTQTPHSSKVFVFFLFDENVKSGKVIFKKHHISIILSPYCYWSFFQLLHIFFAHGSNIASWRESKKVLNKKSLLTATALLAKMQKDKRFSRLF